jgi:hypothetical protein
VRSELVHLGAWPLVLSLGLGHRSLPYHQRGNSEPLSSFCPFTSDDADGPTSLMPFPFGRGGRLAGLWTVVGFVLAILPRCAMTAATASLPSLWLTSKTVVLLG